MFCLMKEAVPVLEQPRLLVDWLRQGPCPASLASNDHALVDNTRDSDCLIQAGVFVALHLLILLLIRFFRSNWSWRLPHACAFWQMTSPMIANSLLRCKFFLVR
jgi:hypothetical protein